MLEKEGAGHCDMRLSGRVGPQGEALDEVRRKPGILDLSRQGKCVFQERTIIIHNLEKRCFIRAARREALLLKVYKRVGSRERGRTTLLWEICMKEKEENGVVTRRNVRLSDNFF